MLSLHCQEPWWTHLACRRKRIEGRKHNVEKYASFTIGSTVRIYRDNTTQYVDLVLMDKLYFPSLEAYLQYYGYATVLPGCPSFEAAVKIYEAFWSKEEIQKVGMIAFHF